MENTICVAPKKCSYCRAFSPDGCQHGYCRNLSVPVEGKWSSCVLFVDAFDRAEQLQPKERDLNREPVAV